MAAERQIYFSPMLFCLFLIFLSVSLSLTLLRSLFFLPLLQTNASNGCYRRIKERQDTLGQATRHVLTRLTKCIDVDGGISGNALH
jgi:hypothetical protein